MEYVSELRWNHQAYKCFLSFPSYLFIEFLLFVLPSSWPYFWPLSYSLPVKQDLFSAFWDFTSDWSYCYPKAKTWSYVSQQAGLQMKTSLSHLVTVFHSNKLIKHSMLSKGERTGKASWERGRSHQKGFPEELIFKWRFEKWRWVYYALKFNKNSQPFIIKSRTGGGGKSKFISEISFSG